MTYSAEIQANKRFLRSLDEIRKSNENDSFAYFTTISSRNTHESPPAEGCQDGSFFVPVI